MKKNTYLDYAASTPLKPQVLMAIQDSLGLEGNASSVHSFGRAQRAKIEEARRIMAQKISVRPEEIIFTGGATEANNTALKGISAASFFTSATEHSSVMEARRDAQRLRVDSKGLIDFNYLESVLKAAPQPALVAVMLVNNETGVIQPIKTLAKMVHQYGGWLHVDAVQAVGKIPFSMTALEADSLTVSAHKIGGPQGVGALVIAPAQGTACLSFQPLLEGGGHEMRRRAGTENVAGIMGFGAALSRAGEDEARQDEWRRWRDTFETTLESAGGIVMGKNAPRVANIVCVAMPHVDAQTQLMAFDLNGFAVSAGSACSSGKIKASHVLTAMGADHACSHSALRFSFGWNSTQEELERAATAWCDLAAQHRKKEQKYG